MEKPRDPLPIGELAKIMTEPGIDAGPIATQLRNDAKVFLLRPSGMKGTGRTASRLLPEDQWLVAKVLSVLRDFGFASYDVAAAASQALNNWRWTPDDLKVPRKPGKITPEWLIQNFGAATPAQRIINDWRRGIDFWVFEMALHRHVKTGERHVAARVRNAENGQGFDFGVDDDYEVRAITTIDLTPHLARLFKD